MPLHSSTHTTSLVKKSHLDFRSLLLKLLLHKLYMEYRLFKALLSIVLFDHNSLVEVFYKNLVISRYIVMQSYSLLWDTGPNKLFRR